MMFVVAFGLAFCVAYLVTIPTIFIAKKWGIVTDRTKRIHPAHTHIGIVPRAGGLPVYIAFMLVSLLFVEINKLYLGIMIASTATIVIGLLDDYFDVSPYIRFFLNIAISALVILFGLGIPFISNPFGGVIHLDTWRVTFTVLGVRHSLLVFADILALVWLTWVTNMVNWSKGIDGQMPGFVAIAAFFLGLLSQRFVVHDVTTTNVLYFALIVSGAYLGFLPFNMFPQKIMPGYGGGALAGFWLGILSILSFGKVGTFVLVLAIPFTDALYTLIRRIKSGASPFRPDRGHLHHRLMDMGWGKRRIAAFYWIVTALLGCASLFLNGLEKLVVFVTIALLMGIFFIAIDSFQKHT